MSRYYHSSNKWHRSEWYIIGKRVVVAMLVVAVAMAVVAAVQAGVLVQAQL